MEYSIVIPAYNAAEFLPSLLDSIMANNLDLNRVEVLVIDDHSTDSTAEIAKSYRACRVVTLEENRGVAGVRNFAIENARGNTIIFIDADCIVARDWFDKHCEARDRMPEAAIISGSMECHLIGRSRSQQLWELVDFYSNWWVNIHPSLTPREELHYLPTANISLNKDIAQRIGGFNPHLRTGEDVDFCYRLHSGGYKTYFEPSIRAFHRSRATLAACMRRHYQFGLHCCRVRSTRKDMPYAWIFRRNVLQSILLSPCVAVGFLFLVFKRWVVITPLKAVLLAPLIFLTKISYSLGVIEGTRSVARQHQ